MVTSDYQVLFESDENSLPSAFFSLFFFLLEEPVSSCLIFYFVLFFVFVLFFFGGHLKALPYAWMLSITGWRGCFSLVTPSPSLSKWPV